MSGLKREDELLLKDLNRMIAEYGLYGLSEDDQLLYSLLTDRYDKFLHEGLKKLRAAPNEEKGGLDGIISFFGGSPRNKMFSRKRQVAPQRVSTNVDSQNTMNNEKYNTQGPTLISEASPSDGISTPTSIAHLSTPVIDLCPSVANGSEEYLGNHWHWILPNVVIGAIPFAAHTTDTPGHLSELQRQCIRRHSRLSCVISCMELDEAVGAEGFAKEIDWETFLGVNSFMYVPLPRDPKTPIQDSVMDDVLECCAQITQRSSAITSQEFGRALVQFNKKSKVKNVGDCEGLSNRNLLEKTETYSPAPSSLPEDQATSTTHLTPVTLDSPILVAYPSIEETIQLTTAAEDTGDGQPVTADTAGNAKDEAEVYVTSMVNDFNNVTETPYNSKTEHDCSPDPIVTADSARESSVTVFTGVVVNKDTVVRDTVGDHTTAVPVGTVVMGTVVPNGGMCNNNNNSNNNNTDNISNNGARASSILAPFTKESQRPTARSTESNLKDKIIKPLFLSKKGFFNDMRAKKEESSNISSSVSAPVTHQSVQRRRVVYIHCKAGLSRCYVIAMCYLMSQLGRTFAEADAYIRAVRCTINPSDEQIRFVKAFEVYTIERAKEANNKVINPEEEARYQATLADVLSLSPAFRERLLQDMEMLT